LNNNEDQSTKNIKEMLKPFSEEVQNAMLISGLMGVDVIRFLDDVKGRKSKLKNDIIKSLDDLPADKLMILSYLVEIMRLDSKNSESRLSQKDIERMIHAAYNDGFNKGKELRIKELKQMREWYGE